MPETPAASSVSYRELPGLREMLDELRDGPEIVRPSAFWEHHAALQYAELQDEGGFAEFKRSVNRHFFQFMVYDPRDPQFRAAIGHWLRRPSPAIAGAKLTERLAPRDGPMAALRARLRGRFYASYVALLWEYARAHGATSAAQRLSEPPLGHPVSVRHRGRLVGEDLCNSLIEFQAIADGMDRPARSVIELGGGYGRLAWVFLSLLPQVRYVLVDIPPGLALAQRYLSELMPDRRLFTFRRFTSYEDIAEDFDRAEIVFLTPNQLDLLPPQRADLFVNVSSLHEMSRPQIDHYFQAIDRHTDGYFFTKQWERSVNPFDDVVITRGEYPVPPTWQSVFERRHPIQRQFFEALYRLPATEVAE